MLFSSISKTWLGPRFECSIAYIEMKKNNCAITSVYSYLPLFATFNIHVFTVIPCCNAVLLTWGHFNLQPALRQLHQLGSKHGAWRSPALGTISGRWTAWGATRVEDASGYPVTSWLWIKYTTTCVHYTRVYLECMVHIYLCKQFLSKSIWWFQTKIGSYPEAVVNITCLKAPPT